ncbi:MAG: bifunctional folylpolyglutamate synthase/dihydrofolate synthase [Alphaproteobacteria bacterium]|nr:bifunctional folylpolyglutamate synthase/dihydrofolate synthase [Alphaproteobacteria bacterium]
MIAAPARRPVRSDEVLARLLTLHPKLIDLSLHRVLRLLGRLGDPHKKLPPVVHVAGTNGKGSTVAYLRAAIEASGRRCHVYTSPHLVRFHERIRLAGKTIGEDALVDALEECERVNAGEPITFFEITTCAAFLCFARVPADAVLLETGMGGRLDTTNVIDRPAVTAITPISMDHMDHLGDTLAKIAAEKAGIFKPGAPAVLAPQPRDAEAVLEARATALHAPLYRAGIEWRCRTTGKGMRYDGRRFAFDLPRPALFGAHQVINAGAAIACLEMLEAIPVSEADIRRAMTTVEWPARLQRLRRGPLVEMLPPGWELWLDGGHNAGCGEVLAEVAKGWRDRPLHLVYGMLNTKEPKGFLQPLAPLVTGLQAVDIPGAQATVSAEQSAANARACGIAAAPAVDVAAAIRAIVAAGQGPARVLICGSLYLAGVVLSEND